MSWEGGHEALTQAWKSMSLSVATFVSKAIELQYPIIPVLESVAPIADQIVINVDTSEHGRDGTWDLVFETLSRLLAVKQVQGLPLKERLQWGRIVESPWNWDAHDKGMEFKRQTDIAINGCTKDWVLVIEADEVVHEDDLGLIKSLTELPEPYAGAQFIRLYFWQYLDQLRMDWSETPLTRLIRRGRGQSRVESNNCDVDGPVWPVDEGFPRLFHYTRIGNPEMIAKRIWSNDILHHEPGELEAPGVYDFGLRRVDSHARTVEKESVDSSVLVPYLGTHPKVMLDWLERQGFYVR